MAAPSPYGRALRALVAGMQVNAGFIAGGALGHVLDGFAGSGPWGTLVGLLLGAAASVAAFVRLRRLLRDEPGDRAKASPVQRRRP